MKTFYAKLYLLIIRARTAPDFVRSKIEQMDHGSLPVEICQTAAKSAFTKQNASNHKSFVSIDGLMALFQRRTSRKGNHSFSIYLFPIGYATAKIISASKFELKWMI
jgi:hypothetical protein